MKVFEEFTYPDRSVVAGTILHIYFYPLKRSTMFRESREFLKSNKIRLFVARTHFGSDYASLNNLTISNHTELAASIKLV